MADNDTRGCPIEGNADLYGLGVRLGLYLQFIALVLARPSVRLSFKAIHSSTIAFILANFIVLVSESSSRTLTAPEAYALFFLLAPQLTVNIIGADLRKGTDLRGILAILLWAGFCYYFTWFWWVGLDVLPLSGCEDEYGFFFTRVSLRGWFRTFNKVIWTISNIGFGFLVLSIPVQILIYYWGVRYMRRKAQEEQEQQRSVHASPTPSNSGTVEQAPRAPRPSDGGLIAQNILQHIYLQGWSLIPFAVFVTGAEVTLRYNNIQGVNTVDSASQLVPLILALGLLIHVIGKTLMKLGHGFRHAFDESATEQQVTADDDDDDHSSTRSNFRRDLREERGWIGAIGRFLFRVYCAFAVGYNPDDEEEPIQSGSNTGCPKSGQYSAVGIELESGTRP